MRRIHRVRPSSAGAPEGPHPLARALAIRLTGRPSGSPPRILLLGAGRGRNLPPLVGAGAKVDAFEPESGIGTSWAKRYDAVLSTHGLLHGEPAAIAQILESLGDALAREGLLYATFASQADPRASRGERTAGGARIERDGPEAGVPHAYFARDELVAMLERRFTLESIRKRMVGTIAGRWAHADTKPSDRVHWFVVARRKNPVRAKG